MKDNGTMDQKEKVMGFLYVILLFLGITIGCCLLIFIYKSDYSTFRQKDFVISKMERVKSYQNAQRQSYSTVETLYEKIYGYNPGVNAIYEEDNIKYMVNELKNMYEKNSWDSRYKSFMHVSSFYYMWYADKKELWSKQNNVDKFRKDLQECELGLNSKKGDLGRR